MIKQGPGLRLLRSREGVTAIEFAIVAPILLLLIFAIVEYSLVLYGEYVLTTATAYAARELRTMNVNNNTGTGACPLTNGATTQSQEQYITCLIKTFAGALLSNPANLSVSATIVNDWNGVTPYAFQSCSNSPSACTAQVQTGNPATCNSNATPGSANACVTNEPPGCTGSPTTPCTFGSSTTTQVSDYQGNPVNVTNPDSGAAGSSGQVIELAVSYQWPIIVPFMNNILGSGANEGNGTWGTYTLTAGAIVENEPSDTPAVITTLSNSNGSR